MADDDEEVMIEDCALHKYLLSNNIIAENKSIELELVKCEHSFVKDSPIQESVDHHKKITLAEDHRSILAYIVLRSGFMFPDQINELDSIVDLEKIQLTSLLSLKEKLVFSAVFCAGIASIYFSKQNFTVLKVIISTLIGLSIFKLLKIKNRYCNTNIMKNFISNVEHLIQSSRETLMYISESEILVKNKLSKQNIILAEIDVLELKSNDYLLLFPELRKQYYRVLKELCVNFIKTLNLINKSVTLIPLAHVNNNCSDISVEDLGDSNFVPSLGELKKTFNILLLLQSDCLKRLFLCNVTELWGEDNDSALKCVMKCLKKLTKTIQGNTLNLDSMLKEARRVNKNYQVNNDNCSINVPFTLKQNDSFFAFSKKLLIKSEVNIFSALHEIRHLEEKLSKFDLMKDSGTVQSDLNEFRNKILDNMLFIRDNLDSFMTCYKDNLNYLISSIRPQPEENVIKDIDSHYHKVEKKTSIPVGKSCFIPSNGDEILISLSGPDISESPSKIDHDDYEPVPEPLPKSVLSELKCAIEEKRKEWIERESKALGASQVDLELDGLRPHYNHILTSSKSRTKSCGEAIIPNEFKLGNNNTINDCESESSNSSSSSDNDIRPCTSSIQTQYLPSSFINNIRLAQEKFNLNTSEEIFD